jgi:hypothetical protein
LVDTNEGVARVSWLGTTRHSADDLVAPRSSEVETSAVDEAIEVLKDILWHGPVRVKEVARRAREASVSERTLHRAKQKLGARSYKRGFVDGGHWVWELPRQASDGPIVLVQDAS